MNPAPAIPGDRGAGRARAGAGQAAAHREPPAAPGGGQQANADLARALEEHDDALALAADDGFHQVWVEAAGNRALAEVLGGLKLKLRRVELAYEARGERSLGEHTSMIEALRARQWDRAAALLRRNWRGSLERLTAQRDTGAEF
ncbi:FCD domain-containing protein [Deinococcus aerius]|uniref:FCD domain-containing protein n=1 Tax=Deinococcus aerius TaxID=200253 RepID=UPI0013FD44AF|nr:FCD domain-containing protein [Deinococcus aerius]